MPQAIRDGILVVLIISGPLVLAAAAIGLIIGILQAATQVQEQTIGSAVKIIGIFGLIIFAGFWMYQYLNQYTTKALSSAFRFVPNQAQKAIPSNASDDDMFNATFDGEDVGDRPLMILAPERLEEKNIPANGIPAGVPYLGAPDIPTAPTITKQPPLPPVENIPKPSTKLELPMSNFQEPKLPPKIPQPSQPKVPELKIPEPKIPEPKIPEPKIPEPKISEPKTPEQPTGQSNKIEITQPENPEKQDNPSNKQESVPNEPVINQNEIQIIQEKPIESTTPIPEGIMSEMIDDATNPSWLN